ncbi:MAG: helix-turn-helix domain-containing protein [Candidatus Borkfalkiaceae bacterium]|nr:helix-turn-helix domain-containing protein [Christensenellaceae bacterium]
MESRLFEILREIKSYMKFLILNVNLNIALCDFYGNIPFEASSYLSEFMVHQCLLCQKIKGKHLKSCLHQQAFVKRKILRNEKPFFGSCYAGVYEYIVPIVENGIYRGFISITGYLPPTPRVSVFNPELNLLQKSTEKTLRSEIPSEKFLQTVIAPLKNSLKLLTYYYNVNEIKPQLKDDYLHQLILQYIAENYLRPLTMPVIAEELHYSESYLSHIFREKQHQSIMQYVHALKIKYAKLLLRATNKNITEISELLGFQDSNYFSAVFKKSTGCSPRTFRNEQQCAAAYPSSPTINAPQTTDR